LHFEDSFEEEKKESVKSKRKEKRRIGKGRGGLFILWRTLG
jgi:hypothetical protein